MLAEVTVAEESEKKGDYEQREEKGELVPGENEPQQEHQESHRRKEGGSCGARAAPRENAGDDVCAAPRRGEQLREGRGPGSP